MGKTFFGEKNYQSRFRGWRRALRAGYVESLIRTLAHERIRHAVAGRAAIDAELTYLRAGQGRMDDARYEAEGWPIGSGSY